MQAAETISAQVVLGDRPIEITLSRCWEAFTWQRRLQLFAAFLPVLFKVGGKQLAVDQGDLEDLKRSINVEKATQQLAAEVPELMSPLIYERDLYLSWSMKRSKAANGVSRVVAVIGIGHLRGVMHAMVEDTGGHLRFADLVGGRNTRAFKDAQRTGAVRDFVRDTVIFSLLFWVWSNWSNLSNWTP